MDIYDWIFFHGVFRCFGLIPTIPTARKGIIIVSAHDDGGRERIS